MFREFAMTTYVSRRLSIVPRVLRFKPWRREIWLQYLAGERVLEWVLERFGDPNLKTADFQSFHGVDPPHNVDPRVALAFERFRATTSGEALQLKHAIRESYRSLHGISIKHGSADPRNMLYHEGRIYIIDFDNARPSRRAEQVDYVDLEYWFGLRPVDADKDRSNESGDPASEPREKPCRMENGGSTSPLVG